MAGFRRGTVPPAEEIFAALEPLLRNRTVFGVDLVEAGLADRVVGYFAELIAGPGAVRATLRKYVS